MLSGTESVCQEASHSILVFTYYTKFLNNSTIFITADKCKQCVCQEILVQEISNISPFVNRAFDQSF